MNHMMELTQIKHQALLAEADARTLAKLAKAGQEPRRANPAQSVGRIIQMVLVMLK